jgi:hypothetical protein
MYPVQPQFDPMQVIRIFFYGVCAGIFLTILFWVKFPSLAPTESPVSKARFGVTPPNAPQQPQQDEREWTPPHKSAKPTILVEQPNQGDMRQYSNMVSATANPVASVVNAVRSTASPAVNVRLADVQCYNATVSEALALRSEPTVESAFIRRLQLNERVEVIEVSDSYDVIKLHDDALFPIGGHWYKVRTAKDNLIGWVFEAAFRERFK